MHSTLIAFASFAGIQASPAEPQAGLKLVPVPARIEVTGFGEVKTMPDVATISYTVRGEGAKSDDVKVIPEPLTTNSYVTVVYGIAP